MRILKSIVITAIILASCAVAIADSLIMEAKYDYSVNSPAIFFLPLGLGIAWVVGKVWKVGRHTKHSRKRAVTENTYEGRMAK